jgi:enoyl-CoA hydratase/carnithine racemase
VVVVKMTTYDPASAPVGLQFIGYRKKGHVAYVTIDRPEVRNALHTYAYVEMRQCWQDIARDPDIYAGIVTGSGSAFCAGRDIKFLAAHQEAGTLTPHEDPSNEMYHWGGGGLPEDVGLNKPLIAAVNGLAVGVGLTLVLQCQLRVMADSAWLGDQHTNVGRLGAPHAKYTALPRAVAAYLTLCNGQLTAQEALAMGVVNRVVPQDQVVSEADQLAAMICRGAPRAVQAAVQLYRLVAATPEVSAYAQHLDKEIAQTADSSEGSAAFKQKREPQWTGQ